MADKTESMKRMEEYVQGKKTATEIMQKAAEQSAQEAAHLKKFKAESAQAKAGGIFAASEISTTAEIPLNPPFAKGEVVHRAIQLDY